MTQQSNTYKNKTQVADPNLGRIPPHDLAAEAVVLGAILLDKHAIDEVVDIVSADMFYKEANSHIYTAILSIYTLRAPIDLITVMAQLRKLGTLDISGGAIYLTELTDRVVSAANIKEHAMIVAETYTQREMILTSMETIQSCYEGVKDIKDIITENDIKRDTLLSVLVTKKATTNFELFKRTIETVSRTHDAENGVTGVPSGLVELDRMLGGWQPSDLIILAARPAMGKTALALTFAANAASKFKRPVAVFSLEMSEEQLMKRMISMESEVELYKFARNKIEDHEWQQIHSRCASLIEAPIFWTTPLPFEYQNFVPNADVSKNSTIYK